MRFTGFTDEWKKTTLGEIAQVVKDKISTSALQSDNYISTENILQNFGGVNDNFNIPANQNITKYAIGDILLANIRPYLKKIWLADRDGGCNADVLVFRPNNNSSFVYYSIANDMFCDYVMTGAKGVKMPRGDKEQILKFEIGLPSEKEQQKIVRLLSLIDERIATQNKIIEDLKKLKSGIIDKLLGGTNGEITVKLGECGDFIRGLTYSIENIVDRDGVVVVRANNIADGEAVNLSNEIVRVNKEISDAQKLRDGDLVICMANGSSSLVGKTSYYKSPSYSFIATVGAFCGVYRSKERITRWLMQTKKYKRAISKCLQGGNGAIANLAPNDILELSFILPDDKAVIAGLLQAFDQRLDVERSFLLNIQKEKQYLLSQMFI